jgi:hypothetical protein
MPLKTKNVSWSDSKNHIFTKVWRKETLRYNFLFNKLASPVVVK